MLAATCAKMSKSSSTRNTLSLKKKYEVLEMARKNPSMSSRALSDTFSCGKTQISTIMKNKEKNH